MKDGVLIIYIYAKVSANNTFLQRFFNINN